MNPVARNEAKYQFIKLVKSGRTLIEAKALMKAASAALHPEYTAEKDLRALEALENINHLLLTRAHAVELMELKLARRKSRAYPSTRQEAIAKFATGFRGRLPLNWKRDGNLIRRGKPNRPRPGSSRGKIGKTRVIGATRVLKDFDTLVNTLAKLQEQHGKHDHGVVKKAFRSIRTQVSATVGKS
jgi:hypothetical protein